MSRIGRMPIPVPSGVDVAIGDDNSLTVKGPRGQLSRDFPRGISFEREDGNIVVARVNDLVGPSHTHDFQKVVVMAGTKEIAMTWYGEMLWRASIPIDAMAASYEVCATDRQGNKGCTTAAMGGMDAAIGGDPGGVDPPNGGGGGCCKIGRASCRERV